MLRHLLTALFATLCIASAAQQSAPEKKVVDFQSDIMRPVRIYGDSSALNLLGSVVFYHNGAVITCDSAVRYNDRRMDCFKNVVINKGTLYAYGDRAEYNGETNTANLFAPVIKMVDKDAVMYTFSFSFNTKSSVARFGMGATMKQKKNILESDHGYYHSNERNFICVERVQIEDTTYMMKSDSVEYDLNNEIGRFFRHAVIWNSKGEILSADRGVRYNKQDRYRFVEKSYVLSEKQEVWADTIDYRALADEANLRDNIQINDEEHKVMAFGDYGDYWGAEQRAILTRNPSLVSYDPEQDTLYMRSDSMFLYSMDRKLALHQDSIAKASVKKVEIEEELIEEPQPELSQAEVAQTAPNPNVPLNNDGVELAMIVPDSLASRMPADSLRSMSAIPLDSLGRPIMDTLRSKIALDSLVEKPKEDSLVRIMRGYRDVRIFRTDFQAVCDSIVGFSIDSTLHMYIDPVLWNEQNQITSDVVDIYTANQQITRAKFIGQPIMSSKVDSLRFNQVKGKEMEAFFRNNEIYRNDVNGNGETYYYMQDESTGAIQGFLVAECANITFMIDSMQVSKIIYKGKPVYSIYPLDKIPYDQPLIMEGFHWEEKRKPTKEDVFTREIRPSESEYYRALPKPDFPITRSIMQTKEQMIQSGHWRERNDVISEDAREFIKSVLNK